MSLHITINELRGPPILLHMQICYLSTVRLSVSTERLFSKASEVVSAKRKNENVEMICSITRD